MPGFDSFSNAGVVCMQAAVVNINGAPMGIAGSLAPGDSTPAKLLKFSKRFGGSAPQPVRATAIGDNNRSRHEYIFNPAQMGELPFLFAAMDLDAYAGFTKTKKVTDNDGSAIVLQSNAPANAAQACVIVTSDAQIADTGDFGLKRYINEWYPLVTITPLLANLEEVKASEWAFFGIPTQAGKLPWGTPFSVATHGATRAGGYLITSDYPMAEDTFLADSDSPTSFDLTYEPVDEDHIHAWNFATAAVVPVTLSGSKTVNFSALTNGTILVVRYESTEILATL